MFLPRLGQLVVSAVLGRSALGGIVDELVESPVEAGQSLRRRWPLTQEAMNRTPCPFPPPCQFNRPFYRWIFPVPRRDVLALSVAIGMGSCGAASPRGFWSGLGFSSRSSSWDLGRRKHGVLVPYLDDILCCHSRLQLSHSPVYSMPPPEMPAPVDHRHRAFGPTPSIIAWGAGKPGTGAVGVGTTHDAPRGWRAERSRR
ncbi:hypothetical protein QBC39DRAFT_437837, partial [Podospora conica]